ncbi:MAG TPA: helix-turn-helix transcriptional regulator [Ktedonobacteraceae bacterium]|nr:helix-turn-helix transcriptional regulator [Ktedonobacteraceae bacterium]
MKVRLRIKEVAAEKGVSMTKLSQRSEVAYNTVRKLFRDPYAEVTLSTLRRLADVLGVSTKDLIEDVPDETQGNQAR